MSNAPSGPCGQSTGSWRRRWLPRSPSSWRRPAIGERDEQPVQPLLVGNGKRREPLTLALALFAHRLAEGNTAMLGQLDPDQSPVGAVAGPADQAIPFKRVQRTGYGRP